MFGRAIWDKLPECIFENLGISNFSKITRVIYPKNHLNQTFDCRLIAPNQQTPLLVSIVLKQIFFNSGQLQISKRVITKQRAITKLHRERCNVDYNEVRKPVTKFVCK